MREDGFSFLVFGFSEKWLLASGGDISRMIA